MKMGEGFRRPHERAPAFAVRPFVEEDFRKAYYVRGDLIIELREKGLLLNRWEKQNLVVLDASILIARLMKDNQEPPHGIFALAVGTGQSGWNLQSPPAATNTQRALWSELARKTFSTTNFVDQNGIPASYPTNVVDFTTAFAEAEAVGPIVEMGLIGGNVNSNLSIRNPVSPPNGPYNPTVDLTQFDTLVNYLSFPVINKPPTSTLTIVWRLTF